ncbi:otogelin-like [Hyla sarda]|uniref:otogelin-like n=1 Tax=Hyla sarda TaxID=327740 RepID=UPI0024C228CE|nr:otogelin-like [Hyla sarda]
MGEAVAVVKIAKPSYDSPIDPTNAFPLPSPLSLGQGHLRMGHKSRRVSNGSSQDIHQNSDEDVGSYVLTFSNTNQVISLPVLCPNPASPEEVADHTLDISRILRVYISRTEEFRRSEHLLVSFSGKNKVLGTGPYRLHSHVDRGLVLAVRVTDAAVTPMREEQEMLGHSADFMVTPGLFTPRAHDRNLVSLEVAERPNFFIHLGSNGTLHVSKWQRSEAFQRGATFIIHKNRWAAGYSAFESFAKPGHFVRISSSFISLNKYHHSAAFRLSSLFRLSDSKLHVIPRSSCEWRYDACTSACYRTCRDPAGEHCKSVPRVEGCFPSCPPDMVMDEVTRKCVYLPDCIEPAVNLTTLQFPTEGPRPTTVKNVTATPARPSTGDRTVTRMTSHSTVTYSPKSGTTIHATMESGKGTKSKTDIVWTQRQTDTPKSITGIVTPPGSATRVMATSVTAIQGSPVPFNRTSTAMSTAPGTVSREATSSYMSRALPTTGEAHKTPATYPPLAAGQQTSETVDQQVNYTTTMSSTTASTGPQTSTTRRTSTGHDVSQPDLGASSLTTTTTHYTLVSGPLVNVTSASQPDLGASPLTTTTTHYTLGYGPLTNATSISQSVITKETSKALETSRSSTDSSPSTKHTILMSLKLVTETKMSITSAVTVLPPTTCLLFARRNESVSLDTLSISGITFPGETPSSSHSTSTTVKPAVTFTSKKAPSPSQTPLLNYKPMTERTGATQTPGVSSQAAVYRPVHTTPDEYTTHVVTKVEGTKLRSSEGATVAANATTKMASLTSEGPSAEVTGTFITHGATQPRTGSKTTTKSTTLLLDLKNVTGAIKSTAYSGGKRSPTDHSLYDTKLPHSSRLTTIIRTISVTMVPGPSEMSTSAETTMTLPTKASDHPLFYTSRTMPSTNPAEYVVASLSPSASHSGQSVTPHATTEKKDFLPGTKTTTPITPWLVPETRTTTSITTRLEPETRTTTPIIPRLEPETRTTTPIIPRLVPETRITTPITPRLVPDTNTTPIIPRLVPETRTTTLITPQLVPDTNTTPITPRLVPDTNTTTSITPRLVLETRTTTPIIPRLEPETRTTTPIIPRLEPETRTTTPIIPQLVPETRTTTPITRLVPETRTTTPITPRLVPDTNTTPITPRLVPETRTTTPIIPRLVPDTRTTTPITTELVPDTRTTTPITPRLVPDARTMTPITTQLVPDARSTTPITLQLVPEARTTTPITTQLVPDTGTMTPITPRLVPDTQTTTAITPRLVPNEMTTSPIAPRLVPGTSSMPALSSKLSAISSEFIKKTTEKPKTLFTTRASRTEGRDLSPHEGDKTTGHITPAPQSVTRSETLVAHGASSEAWMSPGSIAEVKQYSAVTSASGPVLAAALPSTMSHPPIITSPGYPAVTLTSTMSRPPITSLGLPTAALSSTMSRPPIITSPGRREAALSSTMSHPPIITSPGYPAAALSSTMSLPPITSPGHPAAALTSTMSRSPIIITPGHPAASLSSTMSRPPISMSPGYPAAALSSTMSHPPIITSLGHPTAALPSTMSRPPIIMSPGHPTAALSSTMSHPTIITSPGHPTATLTSTMSHPPIITSPDHPTATLTPTMSRSPIITSPGHPEAALSSTMERPSSFTLPGHLTSHSPVSDHTVVTPDVGTKLQSSSAKTPEHSTWGETSQPAPQPRYQTSPPGVTTYVPATPMTHDIRVTGNQTASPTLSPTESGSPRLPLMMMTSLRTFNETERSYPDLWSSTPGITAGITVSSLSSREPATSQMCTPYTENECIKHICVDGQLIQVNKSQHCPYNVTQPSCGLLGFAVQINGDRCCPKWECACRCSIFSDLSFVTFDGHYLAVYKEASYILTLTEEESITVQVSQCRHNQQVNESDITLCLSVLELTYISNQIIIDRLNRKVVVNSRTAWPMVRKYGYKIVDTGNMYLIHTPSDVKIQWFHSSGLMIIESNSTSRPPSMGLCGFCDGNATNDLILPTGRVLSRSEDSEEFVDSWQVPYTLKYVGKERQRDVNCTVMDCSECMEMILHHTFSSCHQYVSPDVFCELWVKDVEYTQDPCKALTAYTAMCHKFNVCIEWRRPDFCPFHCPPSLIHRACLPVCDIPATCQNNEIDLYGSESCIALTEGCVCAEDDVLHRPYTAVCIAESKCACTDGSGTPREIGEVWWTPGAGCCGYQCVDNDTIIPVQQNCSDPPEPQCRRHGEMLVSVSLQGKCCLQKLCVCNETLCDGPIPLCRSHEKLIAYYQDGSCCPRYSCECDPAKCDSDGPPQCREDQIVFAAPGNESCCGTYFCGCKVCSEPVPTCQQGEVLTVSGNLTERCCPTYRCVCDVARCPEITCDLGMSAVEMWTLKSCCPYRTCGCSCDKVPRPECNVGEKLEIDEELVTSAGNPCNCTIYKCVKDIVCVSKEHGVLHPGQTVVQHTSEGMCHSSHCTAAIDPITKYHLINVSSLNCSARCKANQLYEPPGDVTRCCGRCRNVSCVHTLLNGTVLTHRPGSTWISKCVRYDCTNTPIGPVLVTSTVSCPPFNETECIKMGGYVVSFLDGCCKTCKEDGKFCKRVTVRMTIRKNDCRSNTPVNIVSCDGKCPSASIYNYNINTYARFCKCCRELGLQRRVVHLYCSGNSTWVNYSIQEPTDCSCQWS